MKSRKSTLIKYHLKRRLNNGKKKQKNRLKEDYFVEELLKMEDPEVISGLLQVNIQLFGPLSEDNGKKIKKHLEKIKEVN